MDDLYNWKPDTKQAQASSRYLHAAFDAAPEAPPVRGIAGDMASGLKRGLFVGMPQMAGGAMKALSPVDSRAYRSGQELQDSAQAIAGLTEMQRSETDHGVIGNMAVSGAEGIGQMAPVIAGGIVNPLLGAGIAGTMYGGSTYQDTKERMLNQEGLDDAYAAANPTDSRVQKAKRTGLATGVVQGAGDAAMTYLGGRFLKGVFPALGKQSAQGVVRGIAGPGRETLKRFGKAWGAEMLGEGITEAAQDEGQAAIERAAGLKDAPAFGAQALESGQGGVGMAMLLGPLAGPGHYKAFHDARQVQQALIDPTVDPGLRAAAAQLMGNEIAKVDSAAAANFLEHAGNAIGNKEQTGSAPYGLDLDDISILGPLIRTSSPGPSSDDSVRTPPAEFATPPGESLIAREPGGNQGDVNSGQEMSSRLPPYASPGAAFDSDIPDFASPLAGVQPRQTSLQPIASPGAYSSPPAPHVPAGPLGRALARVMPDSALPEARPVMPAMPMRGIAGPMIDADYEPVLPALPAPVSEMEKAQAWAQNEIASGRGLGLMQGHGTSDEQHAANVLRRYQRAQGTGVSEQGSVGSSPLTPHSSPAVASPLTPDSSRSVASRSKRRQLDAAKDDMVVAMAKLGGLDLHQAKQQWGTTVSDDAKELNRHAGRASGMGLAYAFKSGGLPLDRMREALVEHGYLPEDATINDLAEAVHAAARGSHTYSDRADVENRLDQAEQEWLSTQEFSQALELTDDDLDAIGIDGFSADEQQIIMESYEDVAYVLVDLFEETDIESYDDVKKLIMEARNEVKQAIAAYDDAQEAGQQGEAAASEPAGEGAAGGGPAGGDQGRETGSSEHQRTVDSGQGAADTDQGSVSRDQEGSLLLSPDASPSVMDSDDIPSHVVNAVAAPREVMTAVGTATKQQTKDTLNTFLSSGSLSPTNPIRLTTVEELHDIIANGTLRPGKDFEGRSGISAQLVDGKKPIVAYGPNDRISAAIVFPEEAAQSKGMAPNEVKINDKTDVAKLRFVVDGFKELMTFDQLKEAVGEKNNDIGIPASEQKQEDASDSQQSEGIAASEGASGLEIKVKTKPRKANSTDSDSARAINARADDNSQGRVLSALERGATLTRPKASFKNYYVTGLSDKDPDHEIGISATRVKALEKQGVLKIVGMDRYGLGDKQKGEQQSDSQPGETTQVAPQKAASLPSKDKNTPGSIPLGVEKNDKESSTADVGAELWYNRRNHTGRGISWADVRDLNETMRVKEVTKPKVWPRPDYEQLVNDGLHPVFARILKNIYDGIATGPIVKTDESLQRYITTVNRVRDALMEWMQDHESQKRFADSLVEGARRMAAGSSGHRIALSELGKGDDFTKAFLEKLWPEEMRKPSYGRFGRDTEAHGDLVSIGGNRALKALQITSRDMAKFLKEVEGGWPGKREAWQVQGYSVQPSETIPIQKAHRYVTDDDGTRHTEAVWYTRVAGTFPTLEEARAALTGKGAFLLLDKSDRSKGAFATREAAEAAARELATKKGDGGGRDLRGMNIADAERRGPERRGTDENISSQRFMETFGFKGVNFGRKGYINDAERQEYLNHAYDALVDLAEIVDVPIKAMSLNGELGIAFGAQGRGGSAAAHFVPGVNEINMTKTMGAGTLAHEWGHALDHWFAVQAELGKKDEPFLSEHVGYLKSAIDTTGIRPEIVQAFEKIVQTMTRRPLTENEWKTRQAAAINRSTKNVESWLKHARLQFEQMVKGDNKEARLREFDALSRRIVAGDLGDGYVKSGNLAFRPTVAALRNLFKDATGRLLDKQTSNAIQVWARTETTASEAKQAMPEHMPQVATDFERESQAADRQKKGKLYWATRREMFARAFELFVNDRLVENGFRNTFLSDAGLRAAVFPYPRNGEREAVNVAFKSLVDTIETRETEKGTALLSRSAGTVRVDTPLSVEDAGDVIRDFLKFGKFGSSVTLKLADSFDSLPDKIRTAAEDAGGTKDNTYAVLHKDGSVWLIRDAHATREQLETSIFHEVYGHLGIFRLFGIKSIQSLNRLFNRLGGYDGLALIADKHGVREVFDKYWQDARAERVKGMQNARITAELLALIGQKSPSLVQKAKEVWGAFRQALRKIGLMELAHYNDSDLAYLLAQGRKALRKAGKGGEFTVLMTANFSAARESFASTPAATIKAALKSALDLSRIPIRVIQSLSDLPAHIQADMRLYGIEAIDGVFDPATNSMYLVADYIPSAERARELLRHEWFHAGVADKELEALYRYYSQKDMARLQGIADERGFDLSSRSGRLEAAGELAAQLAESNPKNLLLARIVARIKEWLRALGLQLEIGQAEVARIIRDAIQRVQTGPEQAQGARVLAGSAYSATNPPGHEPKFGKTGSKTTDFITVNGSADLWNIPAEVAKRTGGRFPAAPVRLLVGRHFGSHRGFGVAHINAEHSADLAKIGMTAEQYVYSILSRANTIRDTGDQKVLYVFAEGMPRGGAALELRLHNGGYYSIRTAFDMKAVGKVVWSGRTASPGVVKEPYTGVSRQSLPKDEPTASSSAKESSQTAHRPETGVSPKPTLEGLEDQTDITTPPSPDNVNPRYSIAKQDADIAAHAARINAPAKVSDMTKGLFELIGQNMPSRFKASIGMMLSNPWFGSEGRPVRRLVVNLNISRSFVRNQIIFDLFKSSEGYTGIEGLHNQLKKATEAELKQFNELIKYGDRNDVARTFTRDELYRGKTPFGKLSRTVVESYKAFHEIIQAANRVRFEKLAEIALLPYKNEAWFPELQDMLQLRMKLDGELGAAQEVAQLGKLLSSTRRRMGDKELFGDNNPTGKPVTAKVAEAYKKFMDKLEATSEPGLVRMAYKHITEYRGELDKLKNEWGYVKGYAPRMRKDGDWHVSVYRIDTDEDGTPIRTKVFMRPTITEGQARRDVEAIRKDLKSHLKNNYAEGARYEVGYERNTATPSELLGDRGKEQAIEQLIMTAFDNAHVFKTSAEDLAAMKRAVLDEVNKQIMAQGFGRHGISREKTQIEGYRDDDYVSVLKEYISGMAGWLSKMQYAVEVNRESERISAANPEDKVWVHDYFKDSMKVSTYMDEVAATARSVGAVWYLGGKVSSAILNAFQNYTVGQAVLKGMMKKAGRTGEPILMLAKAQKDVMAHVMGKGTLTDEEQEVLRQAVRQGTAHAQTVRFMSGLNEQGFGGRWKKVTEAAMTPFALVEQYLNREPGVLAAYRAFKTTPTGEFDQAAFAKAEEFTNSAHFLMGNENLPELVRKMGALGKTLYLFQGYTHNYLLLMANALKNGEFEVIARSLGAIAALGGVFALPGADDLDKWITKWFGVSYKLKFTMWMKRHAREYGSAGEALEAFVNHGATSVFGVDMSRALAVNLPFVSDPDKTVGERIAGVWGGMVQKPFTALHALGSGQFYRAAESVMPEMIANPMRAYRQATTGATTLAGKPILDETGHQMQYSGMDVAKKVLGFQPLEVSERTTLKSAGRGLQVAWDDERKDYLAALRVARTPEQVKKAIQDVIRWNYRLHQSQAKGLVRPISAESIRRARRFTLGSNDKKRMGWEQEYVD